MHFRYKSPYYRKQIIRQKKNLSFREKIIAAAKTPKTIAVNSVIVLSFLAFSLLLYRDLQSAEILIEPIQSTADLEAKGYTTEVITNLLLDRFQTIKNKALTMYPKDNFISSLERNDQLDIKIEATGLSLRSIFEFVKNELGIKTNRLSGFVLDKSDSLYIYLKYNEHPYAVIQGNPKSFEKSIEQGAEELMTTIEPFLLASYYYYQNRDFEAVHLIRTCLADRYTKDDLWALNLWGLILRRNELHNAAKERFNTVLKKDSTFFRAYANLGLVFTDQEQFDSAFYYYRKSLNIRLSDTTLLYWSQALRIADQTDEAYTKLQQVIQINNKNPGIAGELAMHAILRKDTTNAIVYLREAIRLEPENSNYFNLAGLLYTLRKDFKQAQYYFIKAHEIEPNNLQYLKLILDNLRHNTKNPDPEVIALYEEKQQSAFYYNMAELVVGIELKNKLVYY